MAAESSKPAYTMTPLTRTEPFRMFWGFFFCCFSRSKSLHVLIAARRPELASVSPETEGREHSAVINDGPPCRSHLQLPASEMTLGERALPAPLFVTAAARASPSPKPDLARRNYPGHAAITPTVTPHLQGLLELHSIKS